MFSVCSFICSEIIKILNNFYKDTSHIKFIITINQKSVHSKWMLWMPIEKNINKLPATIFA